MDAVHPSADLGGPGVDQGNRLIAFTSPGSPSLELMIQWRYPAGMGRFKPW